MLYTLSHAHCEPLPELLAQLQPDDALLLWQDGVLQAVKNPHYFANRPNVFVLQADLAARGLSSPLPTLDMAGLVALTERFHPQVAL